MGRAFIAGRLTHELGRQHGLPQRGTQAPRRLTSSPHGSGTAHTRVFAIQHMVEDSGRRRSKRNVSPALTGNIDTVLSVSQDPPHTAVGCVRAEDSAIGPWTFLSITLKGGYLEASRCERRSYPIGTRSKSNDSTSFHRVELVPGTTVGRRDYGPTSFDIGVQEGRRMPTIKLSSLLSESGHPIAEPSRSYLRKNRNVPAARNLRIVRRASNRQDPPSSRLGLGADVSTTDGQMGWSRRRLGARAHRGGSHARLPRRERVAFAHLPQERKSNFSDSRLTSWRSSAPQTKSSRAGARSWARHGEVIQGSACPRPPSAVTQGFGPTSWMSIGTTMPADLRRLMLCPDTSYLMAWRVSSGESGHGPGCIPKSDAQKTITWSIELFRTRIGIWAAIGKASPAPKTASCRGRVNVFL